MTQKEMIAQRIKVQNAKREAKEALEIEQAQQALEADLNKLSDSTVKSSRSKDLIFCSAFILILTFAYVWGG